MKIEAKGTLAVEAGEVGEPALRISYKAASDDSIFKAGVAQRAAEDKAKRLESMLVEKNAELIQRESQIADWQRRYADHMEEIRKLKSAAAILEAERDEARTATIEAADLMQMFKAQAEAKRKVRVKVTPPKDQGRWLAYCEIGSRKSYGCGELKEDAINNLIGFVHKDIGIEVEIVPEKTPGQVLFETIHDGSDWKTAGGDCRANYEKRAAAVIAHHEGSKESQ